MNKKLISIFLFLLYCNLGIGQLNKTPKKGTLKKEIIHCISKPEKTREIIYDYSNGNLSRIDNYLNNSLTSYTKIEYNHYGNEVKRTFYSSHDKIIRFTLSTYDLKQRLEERKILNDNNGLELIYEFDTLARLVTEKYFRDPYTNISCHKIIYEYSGRNLVKRLLYTDCSLKSYEIIIYDDQDRKVKTEFYSYDNLIKYIVYKYQSNNLTNELTYDVLRDEKLTFEKEYIFNSNDQLVEVIENSKLVKKNHYENKRLIRSENYSRILIPRPGGRCKDYVVIYEYY